jgi:hypothetical protein
LTVTGDVQGASASLGAIDGSSLTVTGDVQGASASLGAIDGTSVVVTGTVQGLNLTSTGTLSTAGITSSAAVNVTGTISSTGNITAFSDKRFKFDLDVIDSALDKVKQLTGYTYTLHGNRSAGLLAQDVLEVLPEVVMGSEETNYSLAYGNLMGLIVEAIKELDKKVDRILEKHGSS